MNNTIALKDWFRFIDKEYLSTYVRDGGSSVKFAVTPERVEDGPVRHRGSPLRGPRLSGNQAGREE